MLRAAKLIRSKLGRLELGEYPRNVSEACRVMGYSRDTFYRVKEAHREIETAHPGYLGSQDTDYVGFNKGVGKIYQQTFVDTYSQVACAKVYLQQVPITAADILNDRVLPLF